MKEEQEKEKNENKEKNKKNKKNKKKKISRSKDPMWPTIYTWSSYECDNTINPEWEDSFKIRLQTISINQPAIKKKQEEKILQEEKGDKGGVDEKNANNISSTIRLNILLMDKDKEKSVKLGSVEECVDLKDIPVLVGEPISIEERESQLMKNIKLKPSISEKEYNMLHKKKDAGDVYLDIRLIPSPSMVAAGNMLVELFQTVEGLISSPLQDRWTTDVLQRNVNKVSAILISVESCMKHWMFRSMLLKLQIGNVFFFFNTSIFYLFRQYSEVINNIIFPN